MWNRIWGLHQVTRVESWREKRRNGVRMGKPWNIKAKLYGGGKGFFVSFLSFPFRTIVKDGVFLDVQEEGKKWVFVCGQWHYEEISYWGFVIYVKKIDPKRWVEVEINPILSLEILNSDIVVWSELRQKREETWIELKWKKGEKIYHNKRQSLLWVKIYRFYFLFNKF